jgi:hypothetical protein
MIYGPCLPLLPINRCIICESKMRERVVSVECERPREKVKGCRLQQLQVQQWELGVEFEWMWSSSSMYLYCILSLSLIIWNSPVDVGALPNHVKYCVSVLSLQWATIRTSPVGIPNNWYQSIWFKVVFVFCSKMKFVQIVFWSYQCEEEEETSTLVKIASKSNVGHVRTHPYVPIRWLPTHLLRPDGLTRPEYQLTQPTWLTRIRMTSACTSGMPC